MKESEKICSTCYWHEREKTKPGKAWVCVTGKGDHCNILGKEEFVELKKHFKK